MHLLGYLRRWFVRVAQFYFYAGDEGAVYRWPASWMKRSKMVCSREREKACMSDCWRKRWS